MSVYGGYATRLLRLQLELIQALDQHRRGHKQTVEVRHVHIYPSAQGVVGIINSGKDGSGGEDGSLALDNSSPSESAEQIGHAPHCAVRSPPRRALPGL